MPKLKTRSSIAKRFKLTKRGKVIPYGSAGTSHIMSKKNAKRRRRLRKPTEVTSGQRKMLKKHLGN
jgi:large subunit ribosomal protein L35